MMQSEAQFIAVQDAEIARLRAQVEALRKVLRPFASFATPFNLGRRDEEVVCLTSVTPAKTQYQITLGDCRRAAALLEDTKAGGE